jgi:hypothetical protein
MNLKEILDDLDIDTEEDPLKDVKLDDLDEKARPIVEKAMGLISDQTNTIAARDLQIQTLMSVHKEKEPEKKKEEKEEDLDENETRFRKLESSIEGLKTATTVDTEAEFETNLRAFAEKNKDTVRYVSDIQKLVDDHPTLKTDVPKLITLAKSVFERREELKKEPKKKTTETSGFDVKNVSDLTQGKTISEAFDNAEKQMGKGG